MKTKSFLSVAALLVLPVMGWSQFTVSGWVDGEGYIVKATVDVDWSNATLGQLKVTVANVDPAPETTSSRITGFFLRRPGGQAATSLLNAPDSDPDANVLNPSNWYLADASDFDSVKNYGSYSASFTDYFGAWYDTSGPNTPAGTSLWYPGDPSVGVFDFSFGMDISGYQDNWNSNDYPMVYVRWQTVDGSKSAKGYGGGPGWDPAVPEPSQIASLAVLGLGGLLFVRRRLVCK